mmetsp:Transcript_107104/g.345798  ORF Transcript_107104/g.345798 Transcript_107104/m.345798 type:complete len:230 (-) Transcript_107104:90-779(-)
MRNRCWLQSREVAPLAPIGRRPKPAASCTKSRHARNNSLPGTGVAGWCAATPCRCQDRSWRSWQCRVREGSAQQLPLGRALRSVLRIGATPRRRGMCPLHRGAPTPSIARMLPEAAANIASAANSKSVKQRTDRDDAELVSAAERRAARATTKGTPGQTATTATEGRAAVRQQPCREADRPANSNRAGRPCWRSSDTASAKVAAATKHEVADAIARFERRGLVRARPLR